MLIPSLEQQDTDGDGVMDAEELRAGTDPGSAADEPLCLIRYGCGARIARGAGTPLDGPDAWGVATLLALGLGALARRRRSSA
jgi:hypothetical protein